MRPIVLLCCFFIGLNTPSLVAMEPGNRQRNTLLDDRRLLMIENWFETQHAFDIGDFEEGVAHGIRTCDTATALKLRPEFQQELASMVTSLRGLTRLSENNKAIMKEVIKLRNKATQEVSLTEKARYWKDAFQKFQSISEDKRDLLLLETECESIVAECQALDVMSPVDKVKELERRVNSVNQRCLQSFGRYSFVYTMALSTELKLLQHKGEWAQAAEVAKREVAIFDEILPASYYHIQTLEDQAGSLAKSSQFKAARPVIERACTYIEVIGQRYKYSDLGVTAHLSAGGIAFCDERLEDAEDEYKKAEAIVDALRDGVISKKLILTLGDYHYNCLVKRGKRDEAAALIQKYKMRF